MVYLSVVINFVVIWISRLGVWTLIGWFSLTCIMIGPDIALTKPQVRLSNSKYLVQESHIHWQELLRDQETKKE